ncbi:MAG: ABC transporter ATP-binding protein [Deltaproteobacteria bacterium HGW-Deltaproteobacteria-15]|jgi:ABC-type branched-subunit amino acid transport system ATPase component|nr:MAG: ABC transporter ATP-binding protein [Deltaproteobacteria bacterium HGW-Deltaproteobacteria-15]
MTVIAECHGLNKYFDGVIALDQFSCCMHSGQILGILGPNGAGKTTLFNVIAGFIAPDAGRVSFKGKDLSKLRPHRIANLGIAKTFQNLRLVRRISVLENVLLHFKDQAGERLFNIFCHHGVCARREHENREKAMALLEIAGLAKESNNLADNVSYGQQKLLSLVCCLASDAELLLLDEPVAGIAPEMMRKILAIIRNLPGEGKSVVMIEHNIGALKEICDNLIFMDSGKKVCEGAPLEILEDSRVLEACIGTNRL